MADAAGRRVPRRSREELENLAHEFAAAPAQAQTSIRSLALVVGVGAVVLGGVLAWLLWPQAETTQQHVASETVPGAASQWQQRMDTERERQRRAQKSSDDYLARSAASDTALLADFTKGAERLAKVADAAAVEPAPGPKPAGVAPQAAKSEVAASAPAPAPAAKSQPAPAQQQEAAPKPAPAESAPVEVAKAAPAQPQAAAPEAVPQAKPADCKIYVSELSSSGKLTNADIARMKGAHLDERTQHVFTPPVQVSGRSIVFDVAPNGCVSVARSTFSR